jgi:hypothetical protein
MSNVGTKCLLTVLLTYRLSKKAYPNFFVVYLGVTFIFCKQGGDDLLGSYKMEEIFHDGSNTSIEN